MSTKTNNCVNHKNDCNAEDNINANLECCLREQDMKEYMLNEVILEKEELKNQLNNASKFVNDMLEKNKVLVKELHQNYNNLFNKYRMKTKDLDDSKNNNECLNVKIGGLMKNNESLKCHLKERDAGNKYLEEKICKLEKCLNEEKQTTACLKDQNQNQLRCLEQKSEELTKVTQKLNEKTDELNKEKEVTRKLIPKLDDCMRRIDKLKLQELQQIKNLDMLKTEVEIEQNRNKECNQLVCVQKNNIQELKEGLDKCNRKIAMLNQAMEKEKLQADSFIGKLRKEKCNIEKERGNLEKEVKERKKELEKLESEKEHLKTSTKELKCKLDTVIKNSDEKEKLSMEKFEKIQTETNNLKTDLNVKCQLVVELEDKLSETKKMHKCEAEKAHNLKIQLDNLKHKQNIMKSSSNKCSGKSPATDDSNSNLMISRVNDVLVNSKLDCERITSSAKSPSMMDSSMDDFEDKNQVFEKLISKCNSLVNYFSK
ncbi:Hypothetical protein CINCED_3A010024 [Cinara cedri]|uniref:Uncharacterized protein n=1 Tax=Cinara cedri TaxID=506608 RepID=A0A5E4NF70_9HEMI|nr:Hypothetical protein CINCED_3A010024 [Cinara cedri]